MKPVGHHISKLVYNIFKRNHPILAAIIVNWHQIIGPGFSTRTTPIKITTNWSKKQKYNILHISVDNSSIVVEMSYKQEVIIERIAIYLGYKAISKIRFIVVG